MIAVCMYENNLNGFSYIGKSGWKMSQLKHGGIFCLKVAFIASGGKMHLKKAEYDQIYSFYVITKWQTAGNERMAMDT